ncbi:MAG: GNAT family N-acetyltransferase [Rhodobacteraceae bacterium]|nr:GNAT family N-acetyltransferase [Paracoccaceae bacterium]
MAGTLPDPLGAPRDLPPGRGAAVTEPAQPGFPEHLRADAAALYWEAFGQKLNLPLGPPDKGRAFIASVLRPDFAFAELSETGDLLGVAGFKTTKGAFVGGHFSDVRATYGTVSALWRVLLLEFFERETEPGVLLMDGICVSAAARGQGVGTKLLTRIADHAGATGHHAVRLDVIDTNPRARALYERVGFKATGQTKLGPFARVFGFASATTMVLEVKD